MSTRVSRGISMLACLFRDGRHLCGWRAVYAFGEGLAPGRPVSAPDQRYGHAQGSDWAEDRDGVVAAVLLFELNAYTLADLDLRRRVRGADDVGEHAETFV